MDFLLLLRLLYLASCFREIISSCKWKEYVSPSIGYTLNKIVAKPFLQGTKFIFYSVCAKVKFFGVVYGRGRGLCQP